MLRYNMWGQLLIVLATVSISVLLGDKLLGQEKIQSKKHSESSVDISFIPESAGLISLIRPQAVIKEKKLRSLINANPVFRKYITEDGWTKKKFGISIKKIHQWTYVVASSPRKIEMDLGIFGKGFYTLNILQVEPNYLELVQKIATEKLEFRGKTVYKITSLKMGNGSLGRQHYACFLDKTHFVFSNQLTDLEIAILHCRKKPRSTGLIKQVETFKDYHLFEAQRYSRSSKLLEWREAQFLVRDIQKMFASDLQLATTKAVGFQLGSPMKLKILLEFEKNREAVEFGKKLKHKLDQFNEVAAKLNNAPDLKVRLYARTAKQCLDTSTISQKGKTILLNSEVHIDRNFIAENLSTYETIVKDQIAHRRLRLVGLCLRMYQDTYGYLPNPYFTDKSGYRHSWRIKLLQFTEYQDIYLQYRYDEPWNSKHNKKVTKNVPHYFLHPTEKPESVFSSFQIVTGEGMVFENPEKTKKKVGTHYKEFRDGTSQTIMAVEAKSERHWADPTPFTLKEALTPSRLDSYNKGIIRVLFADGSVRSFPININKKALLAMFSKNGQEAVNVDHLVKKRFELQSLLDQVANEKK